MHYQHDTTTKEREAKEMLKGLGLTDVKANLFMGFLLNF